MNNPNYQVREVAVCWTCVHSEEYDDCLFCTHSLFKDAEGNDDPVEPMGFCPQFQRMEILKS